MHAGDLHFYMRHSFKPAPLEPPLPNQAAAGPAQGAAKGDHVADLSGHNPFAETAPARMEAAARIGAFNNLPPAPASNVASSELGEEACVSRGEYSSLARFVNHGERGIAPLPAAPFPVPSYCVLLPDLLLCLTLPQNMIAIGMHNSLAFRAPLHLITGPPCVGMHACTPITVSTPASACMLDSHSQQKLVLCYQRSLRG